ncbi:2-polyprenylphenol hydroxylase-like oxidoreductase [Beggiatoa alba B18LD]|uniref:2-polyprenylphenol hydroxylase-like oxidoreductase n=1 Tax=Beggiatoa alba B18LD TaxID=395493 RepID=I3CEN6_9GAMM|nr:FAD-binding oxidoreductase [Beggiatoa alba]EIJ42079.1 2-polyprenylphenol hydroxylase-like oxidoreductase [Beggiatoa alba B18LD]
MATYPITLITRDMQQVQFDCQTDEDVISAAERQSIILPQQCRSGACGLCSSVFVQGEYEFTDYNETALPAELRAQHKTLLCRTYPRSALAINTDYNYQTIHFGHIPEAICTIVEKTDLTADVIKLVLQQGEAQESLLSANIIAGQYMHLMPMDKQIKRAYSLANISNWEGRLEFLIQLRPEGQFSKHLKTLKVGDSLIARGTLGEFQLQDNGLKPRWFIAGGTGLSPLLAMLKQMADFAEMHPSRLFFGLRHTNDVFCESDLQDLQAQLLDFQYQICLSREQDSNYYNGSIVQAVETALINLTEKPDVYLCGSDRLVDSLLPKLQAHGITENSIYFERFSG